MTAGAKIVQRATGMYGGLMLCLCGCSHVTRHGEFRQIGHHCYESYVYSLDYRPGGMRRWINRAKAWQCPLRGVITRVEMTESSLKFDALLWATEEVRVNPTDVLLEPDIYLDAGRELYSIGTAPTSIVFQIRPPDPNAEVSIGPRFPALRLTGRCELCPDGREPEFPDFVFYPDSHGFRRFRTRLPAGKYRVVGVIHANYDGPHEALLVLPSACVVDVR